MGYGVSPRFCRRAQARLAFRCVRGLGALPQQCVAMSLTARFPLANLLTNVSP